MKLEEAKKLQSAFKPNLNGMSSRTYKSQEPKGALFYIMRNY